VTLSGGLFVVGLFVVDFGKADRGVLGPFDDRGAGDDFGRSRWRTLAFIAFAFGPRGRARERKSKEGRSGGAQGSPSPCLRLHGERSHPAAYFW